MVRKKRITVPVLNQKGVILFVFEFEDVLFHHDSAVLLPSKPEGPSSSQGATPTKPVTDITGLSAIADVYKFIEDNPEKKMIIAGNTDESGDTDYNFKLSMLRASNIRFLLEGEKKDWVKTSLEKYKTEDIKQILKHYANKKGWNCDPGIINNKFNQKTKNSLKVFQKKNNINVDGIIGEETFGAIYECYITEIADMLQTDLSGLEQFKNNVKYVSDQNKILACGESRQIDANYRSQTNRRVEIYFFDPDLKLEINCPDPYGTYNQKCDLNDCPFVSWKFLIKKHPKPKVVPHDEKWQVLVTGWDEDWFGGDTPPNFLGAMRVHWMMDITIYISSGKYVGGKGKLSFKQFEGYSTPKGVYKCYVIKGIYRDSRPDGSMLRVQSPTIINEEFNVPGNISGSNVTLELELPERELPRYNIAWRADLNEALAKKYLPNTWKSRRPTGEFTFDTPPMTENVTIPLKHGSKIEPPSKGLDGKPVINYWKASIRKLSP